MTGSGMVSAHPAGALAAQYRPLPGAFDEMVDERGKIRAPWAAFVHGLEKLGPQQLTQRSQHVQRLLRENGVTYNVYGASRELERPWELDPLPLLFSLSEWNLLTEGIAQRARLLNALAADIYGRQRLFESGLLPPAVLFRSPGFLRPCHGIQPPGGVFLHWYGVQLSRDASGAWQVLSDRTQGPSGAGYVVEGRIVVSRTLPQEFQNLQVVRLASFYITLRETLKALCPQHGDNPRSVLLSPGTRSLRYFEDVYLARYLGYTLAEGGDLTVRRDGVFLKTLGGLLPVDLILRRVRDADADPLDLRPDSIAGVTGLVQAARNGKALLANALGCAFLETPVLHAFLPGICRLLLSEDLLLPSVPTWWCGDQADRDFIECNFSELVIRPAFGERPDQSLPDPLGQNSKPMLEINDPRRWLSGPHTVAALSRWERQGLHAAMTNSPELFIAQRPVQFSTAPVWDGEKLQPWQVTLRTFAVTRGGDYLVLPGGLSRAAPRGDMLAESVTAGQRSKDVWVQADRPVERISLLSSPIIGLELRRTANDLPSRVADHLFWLGRMMERTEALVRHLRCILVRLTSELQPSGADAVALLVAALSPPGQSRLSAVVNTSAADSGLSESDIWDVIRAEMRSFLIDGDRPGSLGQILRSTQSAAAVIRDRISVDGWRIISQLEFRARTSEGDELGQSIVPLNRLLQGISAFSGLCSDSMTRGPGWRFLDLGRRIERGLQILHLIGGILVDTRTDILPRLEATLEIADSSMTYRYRYLTSLQLAAVLDLILADETNPRAVAFQLTAIAEHLRQLSVGRAAETLGAEQDRVLRAQGLLRLTDVDAISEAGPAGDRDRLQALVVHLSAELRSISEDVTHTYLTHTALPQQLHGAMAPAPAEGST